MSNFAPFLEIRKLYAEVLPLWMADYKATGRMHNDPYLHDWQFSPIEQRVWSDIRCECLPFYPQMPVLNYFLDFGNPFLKIGIECDGKDFHNKERDAIRDDRLSRAGWTIYRIPGHECVRSVSLADMSSDDEQRIRDLMVRYYMDTSEGILHAINVHHFGAEADEDYALACKSTLVKHQTATGAI